LSAAVWARLAGRAAAHHVGVSVDTIIKASSCQATERPSWKLRPCLRAPTAAGRAPGRRKASRKHCLHDRLPGPVEAAQCVKQL